MCLLVREEAGKGPTVVLGAPLPCAPASSRPQAACTHLSWGEASLNGPTLMREGTAGAVQRSPMPWVSPRGHAQTLTYAQAPFTLARTYTCAGVRHILDGSICCWKYCHSPWDFSYSQLVLTPPPPSLVKATPFFFSQLSEYFYLNKSAGKDFKA